MVIIKKCPKASADLLSKKKLFNILSVRKSNRIYSRQEKDAAHMVRMHGFQPGRTYTRLLSKKL